MGAQVGLHLNKDKTVLILAKVKGKQTTTDPAYHPIYPYNDPTNPPCNGIVLPWTILYEDDKPVKIVEAEDYLGSRITRSISAVPELKRRIGLGFKRADDLRNLWRGTGISRKRKIE